MNWKKFPMTGDGNGDGYSCVLPDEIVQNILSRFHSKALMKLRIVCRKWKSLISTSYFERLHAERSVNNPNLLLLDYCTLRGYCLITVSPRAEHVLDQWYLPLLSPDDDLIMLSCQWESRNLVCLVVNWVSFALCNPSVRKMTYLPIQPHSKDVVDDAYGFCYLPSMDQYVIIAICGDQSEMITFSYSNNVVSNFGTGWKLNKTNALFEMTLEAEGVFVKGVLYWIASTTDRWSRGLLCFDLYKEKFFSVEFSDEMTKLVCTLHNLNGDLHVLTPLGDRTSATLWKLDHDVRNLTWIRHYTITMSDRFFVPLMVGEDGEMLIVHDEYLEWYSLHDDRVFRIRRKGDKSFGIIACFKNMKLHADTLLLS